MKTTKSFIALAAILLSFASRAEDAAVTYVMHGKHFIELTESWFPGKTNIPGAMMAIEDDAIATSQNRGRPITDALAIHAWVLDGSDVVIHFLRTGETKRFRSEEVKIMVVDRLPSEKEESFFPPDPA